MRGGTREVWRRHFRYRGLQVSFLLAAGTVIFRAFQLQVVEGTEWRDRAIAQHETRVPLPAPRGTIFDRTGRELAVSRTTYRISVAPHELADRDAAIRAIREVPGVGAAAVRHIARADRRWVVLPGRHSAVRKEELEERVRAGVYFEPVVDRSYPRGALAGEILGRVDAAGRGQSGLELTFDSVLTGQPGYGVRRRDATGASAEWLTTTVVAPTAGRDIYLTLDADLQALAESVLEDAVRASEAEGGDLLIIEPETGALLASASRRRGQVPHLAAASEPYEPGSTLKPFIAAALLSEGLATLSDRVDTGLGKYETAGRTVRDVHAHGSLTLAEVLEVSSNVGMVKFAEKLPTGKQFEYLRAFGFGTPTGLTYPSESAGRLRPPRDWSAQSPASLAIGYEISVTPLQLAMAYGALANGGRLMRPRLVLEARGADGRPLWRSEPEVVRRAIPENVAAGLRRVLARAVTQGTGRSAGVQGLSVAGKTGTAQRFDARSGYSGRAYTASFVGLVPSDEPELVIMVKLDAPSGAYYGGLTAAPVMRTAVRAALAGSHWPAPPLLGEPVKPDEVAGVAAGRVPASGPYVFTLGAPLRRAPLDPDAEPDDSGSAVVPDVEGSSLRAAVGRLHAIGFRVEVRGGGRVVSTEPKAGTRVRRAQHVVVVGNER